MFVKTIFFNNKQKIFIFVFPMEFPSMYFNLTGLGMRYTGSHTAIFGFVFIVFIVLQGTFTYIFPLLQKAV